jgi:hypothetical protein
MDEKLVHARQHCLDQAQGFVDAAERLRDGPWPHIVFHLSLLALEEVGKAPRKNCIDVTLRPLDALPPKTTSPTLEFREC